MSTTRTNSWWLELDDGTLIWIDGDPEDPTDPLNEPPEV